MLFSITGQKVTVSQYRGKKNVVISFVPAAWTPVCSDQWPGYNIVKDLFDKNDAVLLGITVDNIPTLYAWTNQMGKLWFPVLSDFYPHGKVAESLWGSAQRRHHRAGPLRHRQEGRYPLHRRPRHQQTPAPRGAHPGTGKTEVTTPPGAAEPVDLIIPFFSAPRRAFRTPYASKKVLDFSPLFLL